MIDIKKARVRDIMICSHSGQLFYQNKWHKVSDMEKKVSELLTEDIVKSLDIKKNDFVVSVVTPAGLSEDIKKHDKKYVFDFKVVIRVPGSDILKTEFKMKGKVVYEISSKFGKKNTQYFEGVLHVRNPSEDLLSFLDELFDKASSEGVFVTGYKKQKNGYDYQLTSKRYVMKIGQELQSKFGGSLNVSEQLFSRDSQTSKDIFRVNATYTMPPYTKGDFIFKNDEIARVVSVGKDIFAKNLLSSEKFRVENDSGFKKIEPQETNVVGVYPGLTALDPETYDAKELVSSKKHKIDDKVFVVSYGNRLYEA